jgi:hypothetical protein
MNLFSCFASCCSYKKNKLWNLYKIGEERLEKEFDVIKILNTLRNLKIQMKNEIKPATRVEIYNSGKNVIDLDSPRNTKDMNDSDQDGTIPD